MRQGNQDKANYHSSTGVCTDGRGYIYYLVPWLANSEKLQNSTYTHTTQHPAPAHPTPPSPDLLRTACTPASTHTNGFRVMQVYISPSTCSVSKNKSARTYSLRNRTSPSVRGLHAAYASLGPPQSCVCVRIQYPQRSSNSRTSSNPWTGTTASSFITTRNDNFHDDKKGLDTGSAKYLTTPNLSTIQ